MQLPELDKIAITEVELSAPLVDLVGLTGYDAVLVLVRLHGVPVGHAHVALLSGAVDASTLRAAIFEQCKHDILRTGIEHWLGQATTAPTGVDGLTRAAPVPYSGALPSVTVAVCTRNRPGDLERCLAALLTLDYPDLELLVIDNAPSNDESQELVAARFPQVRYVRESRPGLDWARNRAIAEARGEIVAYADDDVIVSPGWVRALATVFAQHPEVMAVTGLVMPYELETSAQVRFELQGGFARGFQRGWYGINLPAGERAATRNAGVGRFGTGANMAYRKSVFERVGYFDPALDVGTATNGGGDLEMFFRVLKAGFLLVYEPRALVRHKHRRDYQSLRTQMTNNGVGFYSYLARCMVHFPEERLAVVRTGLWWLAYWSGRRLVLGQLRAQAEVADLSRAELMGSFVGMRAYFRARKRARELAAGADVPSDALSHPRVIDTPRVSATAIRNVELDDLRALDDVRDYACVRVFASWQGRMLGSVDIHNMYCSITATWLRSALAEWLWIPILEQLTGQAGSAAMDAGVAAFSSSAPTPPRIQPEAAAPSVARELAASIVVATFDRPDDLRLCLRSLQAQRSDRRVEVVVVDNHPESGLTPPIVAEFPGMKLVSETRQGLSYARNRGILHSSGDIVVMTDDDVVAPPEWLERLLAPFARPEVHAVTGNVLPIELETTAQQLFERYGGLGRGFSSFEVGAEWFEAFRNAVPTWDLGATANAAFRASLFRDPKVGLLDEALGAGTPTGVGEDTYLFFRVLKAGHRLAYEPSAVVWHRHRRTMEAFRHQIFSYSKGHVGYHLHTLLKDGEWRSLVRLLGSLPRWRSRQILRILRDEFRGKGSYPLSLSLLELFGNLLGPLALLRSYERVQRLGKSSAQSPVASAAEAEQAAPSSAGSLNNAA